MQNIKTLIVGAGVAGLTCAGLLSKQGINPVIVERESEQNFNKSGYMLGLLPLGGRVLNSLNARKEYFDNSIQMENYEIHHADGRLIKNYPLAFINNTYGSYRGIARTRLIDILRRKSGSATIKFATTITDINHVSNGADVQFSDGRREIYDLVIIADGLHSDTLKCILDENEYIYYDTNWGGWITWLDEEPVSEYMEYWGDGSFLACIL